MSNNHEALWSQIVPILGRDALITDTDTLALLSSDVYSRGTTAAFAIKPKSQDQLPEAIGLIADAGYALFPRGGGLSYTSGYTPSQDNAVIVDLSELNNIVEINETDMTITVESGVTWKQIYDVLTPKKLRLPFFGTFSGAMATVGGGMSNGALFMGTARYGTGAEIVLGMEVITATGQLIKTGQAGFNNGKPFYRSHGPDLTGLFTHDAGALGIKTLVTLRMMKKPLAEAYASFALLETESTMAALSDIARSGRVEEAYALDPAASRLSLDQADLKKDIKRLLNVVKSQGSITRGLKEGAKLVSAGRNFIDESVYTLHVVCAANTRSEVDADLDHCREIIKHYGGGEIANSMPKATRANPFEHPNSVLDATGERWVAMNAKVAHSDVMPLVEAVNASLDKHASAMETHGVSCSYLFIGISSHAFSVEPVLRWQDEWLPLHRSIPQQSYLAKIKEPQPNPEARELVDVIRRELVDLFAAHGAASNQIGKTYHYFSSMEPNTAEFLKQLKKVLDPNNRMNPGALEIPE